MSWTAPFDEPIRLNNGKRLRTLREAAQHVIDLPPRQSLLPHWQTAMACLLSAAEGKGPMMMARVAMVRALAGGAAAREPKPRRKPTKRYRVVS
jgi:hypothetical protein